MAHAGLIPSAGNILHAFGPWVLLGVFVLIFIESGVLFPFLPGDSLLVTAAILAGPLGISPWQVLLVGIPAAILGDQVGYWLGRRLGRRLFRDDARILRTERLEEAERFFARRGGLALVLGRFIPIVRTYVPLAAGSARMSYRRFLAWNAIGAALWVVGMTLVGVLLGGIPFIVDHIDVLMIVVIAVSVLPVVVGTARKHLAARRASDVEVVPDAGAPFATTHMSSVPGAVPARRLPAVVTRRPAVGLFRPTPHAVRAVAVTLAAGLVLLVLGLYLKDHAPDANLVMRLNVHHTGVWGAVANGVYGALEPAWAVILTVAIAGVIRWRSRSWTTALCFGAVVALTWLPSAAYKALVHRPRPDAAILPHPFSPAQTDGSFPSGHTAFVVALAVVTYFLLRDTAWRVPVIVVGIAATAVIGFAVVSDGLHYPSDVLASVAWSLAAAPTARWVVVDVVASRWGRRRPVRTANVAQDGVPSR